jgi:PAS domain S-box-containing protein
MRDSPRAARPGGAEPGERPAEAATEPGVGAGATAALVESATQIVADSSGGGSARLVLPTVLFDVPVAILLIDLEGRTVTYANRAAVAMAADTSLPVPLDEWGTRAGLTDLAGESLATTANPLSRLATGNPVAGEAVRAADRVLWVSGFPLSDRTAAEQLALVVLLEVATPPATEVDPEAAMALLRDRAIIATDLSFCITDPRLPDNPLVWVNPAFTRSTGYTLEEVVNRNCRFLQGPNTDPAAVATLRSEVAAGRAATVTLLNYRKDGSAYWNQVSVSPVFDADDRVVSYVGVQADVTERVRGEGERERAYAAELTARREADAARKDLERAYAAELTARREADAARKDLERLLEDTERLETTLDVDKTLDLLADLIVPAQADWMVVHLSDERGGVTRTIAKHRDGPSADLERYRELAGRELTADSGAKRILNGEGPILMPDPSPTTWRSFVKTDELADVAERLGIGSLMYVPLLARGDRTLGSITFVASPSGRRFDAKNLAVAANLGRRAGLIFENARLYEHVHEVADTLQRSLLPAPPDVEGLRIAEVYLPSDTEAHVGGDFYEVLPLPDGSIGLAVGDVVGHDLTAAAAMGHLRGLLRACAWNNAEDGRGDPVEVLDRVDRLVQGLDVVPLATLLYGRLVRPPTASGPWRFVFANAGHPPAMLRRPDGSVTVLDQAQGVLLGVSETTARHCDEVDVPPGSVLLLFTDGLVERRNDSVDHGLACVAAMLADGDDPKRLVDRLGEMAGEDRQDDTAIMAVEVLAGPQSVRD